MGYIIGKNARLFMTCENSAAAVVLTGSTATAASATTTIGVAGTVVGIGNLGGVTTSDSNTHRIKFVEGIDYQVAQTDDSYQPFGTDQEIITPMAKNWELTITRKTENSMFAKLFESARLGALDYDSLHDGTAEFDSTLGYRFYLYNGSEWKVFYHGLMPEDGYSERVDQQKLTVETIKFRGNYWSASVATGSLNATMSLA
jgi:hypothetical protein